MNGRLLWVTVYKARKLSWPIVVVESLQTAVIGPASLAHGVGLAPFGVSFPDEADGVFHRDAILFGLVVVKHRGGHNLVAKRTMNSGSRHGSRLVNCVR